MRICAATMRIVVNKLHNNAVITIDVFLLVYVIIICAVYIILYYISMEFLGRAGRAPRQRWGGRGESQCTPLYAIVP